MSETGTRTALVMSGGGARAAYQVGVLQAIRDVVGDGRQNPFQIICGTSAGAINAVALACGAQNFRAAVDDLADVWWNFRTNQVYRSDIGGMSLTSVRWLGALALGWVFRSNPKYLLDNRPLAELLRQRLDFSRIDQAIATGALYAISVTASGYTSGQSVSFFQAQAEVKPWTRAQRIGSRVRLGIDHLLASSALPFIFPAMRIHREFFGDGSMRQLAPISPAIHMGADRVFVIGSSHLQEPDVRLVQSTYPSLAQIAGHVMSAIFLDSLAADIERLERINQTLSRIPEDLRVENGIRLRPIRALIIQPSERIDRLAARHGRVLPWPVRTLLRGVGAMHRRGGALASYLLFEQPFTRALIEMGYRDTMARRDEVEAFFGP
ncbi:MAG TPA: patatin-like phospholipase family protein [Rhodocyclaceae bacterium]